MQKLSTDKVKLKIIHAQAGAISVSDVLRVNGPHAATILKVIPEAYVADSFEQAVTFAVHLGGDTDTVAAMTGAISAARSGASAIPSRWLDALENGDRGRSHVESFAPRLIS